MQLPHGLLAIPAIGDHRFPALLGKLRALVLSEIVRWDAPSLPAWPAARAAIAAARGAALDAIGRDDAIAPLLAAMSGSFPRERALARAIPVVLAALAEQRPTEGPSVRWEAPPGADAPPDGPRHRIPGHVAHLALLDANPLSMIEAHPEKSGNAIDLGGEPIEAWLASLSGALEAIRAALPTLHAETSLSLSRVVPVGVDRERHLSASYREAPGLVYLTLHPAPLTMAEAIVHETQHGKLNVLSWLDPILRNGHTTWTPSPVRPDLRPLVGVLLAAHAFVPVAALHARLAEIDHPIARARGFDERRAQVIAGNERALAIVRELGEPTPIGTKVIEALEALHAATRAGAGAITDRDALPPG